MVLALAGFKLLSFLLRVRGCINLLHRFFPSFPVGTEPYLGCGYSDIYIYISTYLSLAGPSKSASKVTLSELKTSISSILERWNNTLFGVLRRLKAYTPSSILLPVGDRL